MGTPRDALVHVAVSGAAPPTAEYAHRLLRHLGAAVTGADAGALVLRHRCANCGSGDHGKPYLQGLPLDISLAHDRFAVAVAVTDRGAVGVDVQGWAATSFDGFDDVVLAAQEAATGPVERARTWVRKEALLKATGRGLAQDPRTVVLGPPGEDPRVMHWDAGDAQLHDLAAPAGCVAAVAVLSSRPVHVVLHDAGELLTPARAERGRRASG